ncbi:hypothetical protein P691DRAFT_760277 [Macrolepiota fuliginosa MF-IS2]|uniref:LIM zinc-binding domain-containing protein n=1 Tax=Macrolepiota fuliginosa MF-IS2 TaxID=1400762 RepID=A0A9P6C1Q3_9AGAR|nr:hypothetical protein P691DRAFT_760277 [Macrolepiota fuliginosa MF-IS2]
MASLLAPSVNQPTRISQVLPTVKCSSCNQPVPMAELVEHICAKSPPVPAIPNPSYKPHPPANAANSFPTRVASPGPPTGLQRLGTPPIRPPQSPRPPLRVASPMNERPRISTGAGAPPSSFPQRSSPLAQHAANDRLASSQWPRDFAPQVTSPLRPNLPTSPWPADGRARSTSNVSLSPPVSSPNAGTPYHSPSIPGSSSFPPPPLSAARADGRVNSFVPTAEVGIDTKSGGEAGMAGVGRRGFAAAARAAMFVAPVGFSMDRRPNPPRFLDIDAASRSNDTPPLSAGSGYSSHSPGPLSPVPQAELIPEPLSRLPRTPSPFQPQMASSPEQLPLPTKSPVEEMNNGTGLSPLDRLPFFGKYKNKLPGLSASPEPMSASGDVTQPPPRTSRESSRDTIRDTMSSKYSGDSPLFRTFSVSTTTSQGLKRDTALPPLPDHDSDTECGLAYADSSGDEEADPKAQTGSDTKTSSILRSDSTATSSSGRVHSPPLGQKKASHSRDDSGDSSYSSASESGTKPLSLKFGGTGRHRSASGSSNDTKSTYSRITSVGPLAGPLSRGLFDNTMETLMEEVALGASPQEAPAPYHAAAEQRQSTGEVNQDKGIGFVTMSSGPPHRSNTVQVPPHSPENKPPKLPVRAKTTNDRDKSLLEPLAARKEKVRKLRVCLRCEKRIEDGRWVKVDTGGALCERCWKNMYLPKCRRCQVPIEKQAVSSADGQLKGKYHKECFNCHVCHQPFPDKSFYVYDGKPLCAYHYHEANRSLCAATHCGQPIEGPCAVSHTGEKYHPDHMTCEYHDNPPCNERLKEYWEIDGKMLCERHAARVTSDENEEKAWVQTAKAKKRVTRFMNLGNAGFDGDLL